MKRRVGDNIATAMAARDVASAAELARRCDLNEKTVRRWLDGETLPELDNLTRVAVELQRDVSWFYMDQQIKEAA